MKPFLYFIFEKCVFCTLYSK